MESTNKKVILVRHGEGYHNLYCDLTIFDASLTEKGKEEATQAGERLSLEFKGKSPQVMFVSPLTRTLETATNIHRVLTRNGSSMPMMTTEKCREGCNLNVINHRRKLTELKTVWTNFDWSLLSDATDNDTLAPTEYRENIVDEIEVVRKRAKEFLTFLESRQEQTIVVVTHSGFMRCLCSEICGLPRDVSIGTFPTGTGVAIQYSSVEKIWKLENELSVVEVHPRN
eukprot:TRINITY_DN11972_c0_g1_i1.p1 TRINITY_DN11972_c0_g1~~TRINITY_DN11972_c0_g1_i1.p1  ORF type:complete len:227 (+),score=10.66 TRINITY_DN11972_c0_g1_i1:24-704(+)